MVGRGILELGSARAVLAGGLGIKEVESFRMLDRLAEALGGAISTTRAAVDVETDRQAKSWPQ